MAERSGGGTFLSTSTSGRVCSLGCRTEESAGRIALATDHVELRLVCGAAFEQAVSMRLNHVHRGIDGEACGGDSAPDPFAHRLLAPQAAGVASARRREASCDRKAAVDRPGGALEFPNLCRYKEDGGDGHLKRSHHANSSCQRGLLVHPVPRVRDLAPRIGNSLPV